jgi:hypothetical protein
VTKTLITRFAPYLEDDRRFFQRQPTRRHYIRYMSAGELAEWQAKGIALPAAPKNHAWYTVVRQEAPGFRSRRFFSYPAEAGDGAPEDVARHVYESLADDPQVESTIKMIVAVIEREVRS